MMKAIECTAQVHADGRLEVPATVLRELQILPNTEIKVLLLKLDETKESPFLDESARSQKRHEAVAALLDLRKEFAGMDFNLTDEITRMREEEDA